MFDNASANQCIQGATQTPSMLDVIKTVTSVVVIPVAAFTFFLGYRQKERERTRAYYHKVVVDIVLPQILDFFREQSDLMTEAARQADKGMASSRKSIPRSCSVSISNFSTGLYALLDKVTERTLIFDEKITFQIREDIEDIEDSITAWFGDITLHKRRNTEEIAQLLQSGQRTVIKRLYRGEFRDF